MTSSLLALVLHSLALPAFAQDPVAIDLCARPRGERSAAVDAARTAAADDRERVRALLAAQAVLMALDEADADAPQTCLAYLEGALSGDAARRDAALIAARAGGALDAEGRPALVERALDPSEALAPRIDPGTPTGRAQLQYRAWMAGVGGCRLGGGTAEVALSAGPVYATATWATYLGPDRLVHPERFFAWSARHQAESTLPEPGDEVRGGGVLLSGYRWDAQDLDAAQASALAWNRYLRERLGLAEADVVEVEMEVDARHANLAAPTGTVALEGTSRAIAALPPCP